jgi:hypothetical protein
MNRETRDAVAAETGKLFPAADHPEVEPDWLAFAHHVQDERGDGGLDQLREASPSFVEWEAKHGQIPKRGLGRNPAQGRASNPRPAEPETLAEKSAKLVELSRRYNATPTITRVN